MPGRQRAVGFDLDMTLVDTRPGIERALLALAAETGRPVDAAGVVAALGPPIDETLGRSVDGVFGNVWAEAKAEPLRASDAVCFVGDHPADMVAAVRASVVGVGVPSGASTREQLAAAGAQRVVGSLTELARLLPDLVTPAR